MGNIQENTVKIICRAFFIKFNNILSLLRYPSWHLINKKNKMYEHVIVNLNPVAYEYIETLKKCGISKFVR